ncbi:MAG: GNAT family N-acetyltransferase [Planctomycetes bacterium]|nr:GNAT family N-acetyltransferase [Planctomycetota bacterium]
MYRRTWVANDEAGKRFCAVAGFPLDAGAMVRQAPDSSVFLENSGGEVVARCSLWWRHTPGHEGHTVGFVGHYAVVDPAAAAPLFNVALERLAAQGCTLVIGPMDGNTWQRYRLLTERGDEPPFFLEPDNPDEWPGQFTAAGFTPLAQYYSALNTDLASGAARIEPLERKVATRGITVKSLHPERFEQEMKRVHALSVESFRDNFLYTPIDEVDFLAQYTPLRRYLRSDLILLAEQGDTLIGFIFAIPNLVQAQIGRPPDTAIIKTMAVHPGHAGIGLGSLLMARCEQAVLAAGFTRAIHALFHEANRSGRISGHTARVIRRYTLFGRLLGGGP